ncbi:unnamed protein product [Spirodela intermedia]|uniref:Uncharacterized protein n=1 Tax=Spirodela intermedia TaxID=51605 RepID=A0A7I8L6I5_SPIIN|nr:unnamed protein product [Spirodela intermedia]
MIGIYGKPILFMMIKLSIVLCIGISEVPDRVYGLALCRGDAGANKCQECHAGVARDAAERCPGNKGATIFYEFCHLRYSDQDFFGSSTGTEYYMSNAENASDAPTFERLLGDPLDNLTIRAVSSERRFATGRVDFSNLQKIYALVQCTRDLAPEICDVCLRGEIGYTPEFCKSKKGARVTGGSCYLQYEVDPFFNISAATDPLPPPPPPVLRHTSPPPAGTPAAGDTKNSSILIVAITVVLTVSLASMATIWICIRRKRRTKIIETLKLATMNFSDQNKLGEGGFGVVYKGVLADRQLIAVKRVVTSSGQGIGELMNEVALVAKLQHRNLVRLMGYCLQAQEKLLVYEYLPNKNLDRLLFGIARGLLYLHEDSRPKIVHRDLKASNILLDEGVKPKIADFGLARLFGNEQSYGNTDRIAGTHGYMAPEYVMQGQISTKSDVYSFGVLLLEIVTGKRCAGYYGSDPPTDFISYIWRHWEEGNPIQLLDRGIYEGCSAEEVLRRIHIGLLCVQRDPLERPSMSLVVVMLSSHSTSLLTISPFQCSTSTSEDPGVTSRPTGIPSRPLPLINDASAINSDITTLEPR